MLHFAEKGLSAPSFLFRKAHRMIQKRHLRCFQFQLLGEDFLVHRSARHRGQSHSGASDRNILRDDPRIHRAGQPVLRCIASAHLRQVAHQYQRDGRHRGKVLPFRHVFTQVVTRHRYQFISFSIIQISPLCGTYINIDILIVQRAGRRAHSFLRTVHAVGSPKQIRKLLQRKLLVGAFRAVARGGLLHTVGTYPQGHSELHSP